MTWELQDWLGVGRISSGELWSLFFALAATIMQVSGSAGLRPSGCCQPCTARAVPCCAFKLAIVMDVQYIDGDALSFFCLKHNDLMSQGSSLNSHAAMLTSFAC